MPPLPRKTFDATLFMIAVIMQRLVSAFADILGSCFGNCLTSKLCPDVKKLNCIDSSGAADSSRSEKWTTAARASSEFSGGFVGWNVASVRLTFIQLRSYVTVSIFIMFELLGIIVEAYSFRLSTLSRVENLDYPNLTVRHLWAQWMFIRNIDTRSIFRYDFSNFKNS